MLDVDALISAIYARPAVWDKRVKLYSSRAAVDRCWKEISAELQTEEIVVRKKWKYLRDNFAVECGKRLQSLSEDSPESGLPPKWQYYQQLMFLKDIVTPRAPSGSFKFSENFQTIEPDQREQAGPLPQENIQDGIVKVGSPYSCPEEREEDDFSDWQQQREAHDDINIPVTQGERTPPSALNRRKRTFSSRNYYNYNKLLEMEEKKVHHLYNKPTRAVVDEEDNDLMFFKTLLPHVRSIPQRMKLQFQSEIQAVVQKYAYPREERINSPSSESDKPSSVPI